MISGFNFEKSHILFKITPVFFSVVTLDELRVNSWTRTTHFWRKNDFFWRNNVKFWETQKVPSFSHYQVVSGILNQFMNMSSLKVAWFQCFSCYRTLTSGQCSFPRLLNPNWPIQISGASAVRQSRSQSPRVCWSALTKRHVGSGNEIGCTQGWLMRYIDDM